MTYEGFFFGGGVRNLDRDLALTSGVAEYPALSTNRISGWILEIKRPDYPAGNPVHPFHKKNILEQKKKVLRH